MITIIEAIGKEINYLLSSNYTNERIIGIPINNGNLNNFEKIINEINIITSIIQKGKNKLLLYDGLFLFIYIKYEELETSDYINLFIKLADNKDEFDNY